MNEQWRDALGAIGPIGATPERIDEIGVSDQLIQQLLVAGLLRIDRLNHADAYGALVDHAPGAISAYMLTPTGAEAIGIDPTHNREP
jgi:hypothetical protein